MLLRLAAIGTLGYFAYKYFVPGKAALPPVAGGPFSEKAVLQSDPDHAPPAELYDDMS